MQVLVTGATGFLGRRVVAELVARHHQVRCLVHSPGSERQIAVRDVDIHYGNVLDADSIRMAMYDVQSVVHLVGIIRPQKGLTFDSVHRQGAANVAEAASSGGAREIIHVSALGATSNPAYPYLFSKHQGELRVRNSGIAHTILRPSVIFGPGDEFVTALAGLVRLGPVVPVIGNGRNRMQPVALDDVAHCIADSVGNSLVKGKTLNLAGPDRLSYNDLLDEVALQGGKSAVHIPTGPPSPSHHASSAEGADDIGQRRIWIRTWRRPDIGIIRVTQAVRYIELFSNRGFCDACDDTGWGCPKNIRKLTLSGRRNESGGRCEALCRQGGVVELRDA